MKERWDETPNMPSYKPLLPAIQWVDHGASAPTGLQHAILHISINMIYWQRTNKWARRYPATCRNHCKCFAELPGGFRGVSRALWWGFDSSTSSSGTCHWALPVCWCWEFLAVWAFSVRNSRGSYKDLAEKWVSSSSLWRWGLGLMPPQSWLNDHLLVKGFDSRTESNGIKVLQLLAGIRCSRFHVLIAVDLRYLDHKCTAHSWTHTHI